MLIVQALTPAAAQQAGLPAAAAYQASSLVVRLSLKIFNCTPGELPQGLRDQLCSWLCATPAGAEGYIRPGCVHLTVQVQSASCCIFWHAAFQWYSRNRAIKAIVQFSGNLDSRSSRNILHAL